MSKWCHVVSCVLASCFLILVHQVVSHTRQYGPLVHGRRPAVPVSGIASLIELSDEQEQLASAAEGPGQIESWGIIGGPKTGTGAKINQLFAKTVQGSSDVSESDDEDDLSKIYDGDGDDSIADLWEGDENDDTWKAYEQEYVTTKWERAQDAFKKWRNGLEMYGVDSRKNFLVTHDSVEFKQVLPFYMSTQHTYTASDLFMRLIPKESPYKKKKSVGRCAVVGNSGILRASGCGPQIDSADYVFRCNIPPIEDYEHDVGVKTNLTTMNPSMFIFDHGTVSLTRKPDFPYNLVLEPYDGVIIIPCFSHYFYLRQCIKARKQYYRENANMTFLNPQHFSNVWDYWKDRGLKDLPSTGFYIVSTAAMLCDQVDLYGFWPFEKSGFSGRTEHVMYHYWEDGKWGPAHDKSGEFAQLFDMHREGALRLHLGNCSSS